MNTDALDKKLEHAERCPFPPICVCGATEASSQLSALKERIATLEDKAGIDDLEALRVNLIEMQNIKLLAQIADLEAERTWRPIEVLPPRNVRYLVTANFIDYGSAYYWKNENEWQGCGFIPTHWMPLPPKEE